MSRKIAVVGLLLAAGAMLLLWRPWGGGAGGSTARDASISPDEAESSPVPPIGGDAARGPGRSSSLAAPKGAIRGVVQRVSDRRGVSGAELLWLDATREPAEERGRLRTGPSGRFSVGLDAGRYQIRVEAPGYRLEEESPVLQVMSDARSENWVVGVERESVLRGQVVDGEGRGLVGIRVGLVGVRRGGRWFRHRPERGGVFSEADGKFVLRVPPGVLRVALRMGKRWVVSPTLLMPAGSEVSGLRLVARADASLTGQVLGPGGARIGNASVLIDDVSGQREIRCDGDGRFKVDELSAGELLLMPRGPKMAARSVSRIELRRGATARVVLQMQPTQRQVGRVLGHDGGAVGGARIEVQLLTPKGIARQLIATPPLRSAADGRFVLDLDARPRAIAAYAPGPLRGYRKGIVPQAGELIVPLRKPGELAGRISSGGGKPLGFVRLMVEDGGRRQKLWLITSKDGRFRLPGLMPGTVKVDVEADAYASKRAVVAVRSGVTTPLEVRLSAAGTITSSVRDAGGLPLVGAEVRVEDHPARASCDFHGRFTLRGLAAGVYTLQVRHPGQRSQRIEKVRVSAGGRASLAAITLQPLSPRAPEVWRPSSVRALP